MKINDRLKVIGDLIDEGSTFLDIGCDHAFLDIYVVRKNKNIKAIASDINEGPVKIARENIKKCGLTDKIEVRLGDGLDTYTDDIDTLVISGMGGRNIIGICKYKTKILKKINTIILSPNNYQEDVRRFLTKNGFYIVDEELVKEKKFIYQIMKFKRGKKRYSKEDYFFGPILLEKKGNLFLDYFRREKLSREILLQVLPKNYRVKRYKTKKEIKMIEKYINN